MVLVNVSLNERMRMPFYDGDTYTYTRIKIAKLIYTYVSADRSELDDFFFAVHRHKPRMPKNQINKIQASNQAYSTII